VTLKQVQQAQTRLILAQTNREEAREKLRQAVLQARKQHTLAEIGETLGMTRQGVYDLLNRNGRK
jgi:hypothetical protein